MSQASRADSYLKVRCHRVWEAFSTFLFRKSTAPTRMYRFSEIIGVLFRREPPSIHQWMFQVRLLRLCSLLRRIWSKRLFRSCGSSIFLLKRIIVKTMALQLRLLKSPSPHAFSSYVLSVKSNALKAFLRQYSIKLS
jgi:hypothetical protein